MNFIDPQLQPILDKDAVLFPALAAVTSRASAMAAML